MALSILDGNQTATTLSTILTSGAHIPAHTVVSLGTQAITDVQSAVSGSVVSISNFPSTQTIAGTVTANLADQLYDSGTPVFVAAYLNSPGGTVIPVSQDANAGMPISGTVTVSNQPTLDSIDDVQRGIVSAAPVYFARGAQSSAGWTTLQGIFFDLTENGEGVPISLPSGVTSIGVTVKNSVTIGSLPAISGTVTANIASTTVTVSALPSGALTTRFGSVTTANTAQITSAVTNTSRKYLLAQNISAGTVTIGIGFSPTTTQGIQLTAGAGLTFDAFCPTGAVYWLGATTGAAFTILEG